MEYVAYERVHGPLLMQDRLDVIGAQITWAIAALGGSHAEPADFLPVWDEAAREQSDDDIIAAIRAIQERKKENE
jgi:hypothetical protein